jgi:hypothetical protein
MKYLFVCIIGLGLLLGCEKEEPIDTLLVDRKTPGTLTVHGQFIDFKKTVNTDPFRRRYG